MFRLIKVKDDDRLQSRAKQMESHTAETNKAELSCAFEHAGGSQVANQIIKIFMVNVFYHEREFSESRGVAVANATDHRMSFAFKEVEDRQPMPAMRLWTDD